MKPRAHQGKPFAKRLKKKWPNAIPVHASWLNQIEIYFSIVQRKVLTPNDFPRLEAVKEHLINFQTRYQKIARPFNWRFTRKDLEKKLRQISNQVVEAQELADLQSLMEEQSLLQDVPKEMSSICAYT